MEEESWIVEPARPEDVFTEDPEELWAAVLRRKGAEYALLSTMPIDPSLN
jgi:putative transcriptional regulator